MAQHKKTVGLNPGFAHRVLPAGLSRPAGYIAKGLTAASVTGLIAMAAPGSKAEAAAQLLPKPRNGNPLTMPVGGATFYSKPAMVDIDADGDLDIFVGGDEGMIQYFENEGTNSAPDFQLRVKADNPFWYYDSSAETYTPYDVGDDAAPAFVDLDGDGDMDAFIGEQNGYINYFENTGTASAPEFIERTGSDAPAPLWMESEGGGYYQSLDVGDDATPAFADIDDDGDQDLFVGDRDGGGTIRYYENTGTASAPAFATTPEEDPFGLYSRNSYSTPTFVDIDGDGDLDAFIGNSSGDVDFFKNVGTASVPDFDYIEGGGAIKAIIPLSSMDVGSRSAPVFGDIDGDGDMDAFVGGTGQYGDDDMVFFFENTGTANAPAFTKINGKASPTWGFDVGWYSTPVLADIDGDGDLDAFIGASDGRVFFSENTGTAQKADFKEINRNDTNNPFNGIDFGYRSVPAFADIDGDGDLDAFIGEYDDILFYKNFGTATAPDFVAQPGDDPFRDVDLGKYNAPTFFDIDGDGDLDAFVGSNAYSYSSYSYGGVINYYELDANGQFVEKPDKNPFRNFVPEEDGDNLNPVVAIADFDGDGTLEALVGSYDGTVTYFEYDDTVVPPEFVENDAYADADMGLLELIGDSAPTTADIDGDGDMDLVFGETYGRMVFVENREIVVTSNGSGSSGTAAWFGGGGSSSTCFIDSAYGDRDVGSDAQMDHDGWAPLQAAKRLWSKLLSR